MLPQVHKGNGILVEMGKNVTLANLAEEIIFIVLVIFSILRIDLRRMPNSLSLPDEFRTCVIVWREASILNIFSLQLLPVELKKCSSKKIERVKMKQN